jgi:hypothetical protein
MSSASSAVFAGRRRRRPRSSSAVGHETRRSTTPSIRRRPRSASEAGNVPQAAARNGRVRPAVPFPTENRRVVDAFEEERVPALAYRAVKLFISGETRGRAESLFLMLSLVRDPSMASAFPGAAGTLWRADRRPSVAAECPDTQVFAGSFPIEKPSITVPPGFRRLYLRARANPWDPDLLLDSPRGRGHASREDDGRGESFVAISGAPPYIARLAVDRPTRDSVCRMADICLLHDLPAADGVAMSIDGGVS